MNSKVKSLVFITALFINLSTAFSQFAEDRYDTLLSVINTTFVTNQEYYFNHYGSVVSENNILLFGDSVLIVPNSFSSYIQKYNTSNNTLTTLNFQRFGTDRGISSAASIKTNTNNLTFSFFGMKTDAYSSNEDSILVLYKHNSITDAITTETIQTQDGDFRKGILQMCFMGDTLFMFNHMGYGNYYDSIEVIKKHYNQNGFMNTYIKLPIYVDNLMASIVYNNVMYVSGKGFSGDSYLFNSSNGMTFSLNAGYASSIYNNYNDVVAMDTLNGVLYLGVDAGDGDYKILKTSDGVNYSELVSQTQGYVASMKNFKNQLYYVLSNSSQSGIPEVKYFHPNEVIISSRDSLGTNYHNGYTYNIQTLNNKLYVSGGFEDYTNIDYGTYIFQLIQPTANFTVSSNNWCLNAPYTLVNQSVNADSVRWVKDNNYFAGTNNNYVAMFSTPGSHTIGLIAITGTQTDTLMYVLNVYAISTSMNTSLLGCQNANTTISPSISGAMAPATYTWNLSPALNAPSLSTANVTFSASVTGSYTYQLLVSDVNNCTATTPVGTISINSSKDFSGIVTLSASPVAGEVSLYRYEPVLTKFDSITTIPLNVSGEFTFSPVHANTYLIKFLPTANSLQVTYAPNDISWMDATIYTHGCINNSTVAITPAPIVNIGTGPGVLAGKVTEGVGYGNKGNSAFAPGNPIGGLTIKAGRNPGGDIVGQSKTDASGGYTISGLPADVAGQTYFVLVDVAGLDTNTTYHRAIFTGSLQYTNLDFVVDSTKINPTLNFVGVNEYKINNNAVTVYPNPSSGIVNVLFSLTEPETVEVVLADITGKQIKSIVPQTLFYNGENKIVTKLNGVNSGVYFMKLKIGNTEKTVKLIIAD